MYAYCKPYNDTENPYRTSGLSVWFLLNYLKTMGVLMTNGYDSRYPNWVMGPGCVGV